MERGAPHFSGGIRTSQPRQGNPGCLRVVLTQHGSWAARQAPNLWSPGCKLKQSSSGKISGVVAAGYHYQPTTQTDPALLMQLALGVQGEIYMGCNTGVNLGLSV